MSGRPNTLGLALSPKAKLAAELLEKLKELLDKLCGITGVTNANILQSDPLYHQLQAVFGGEAKADIGKATACDDWRKLPPIVIEAIGRVPELGKQIPIFVKVADALEVLQNLADMLCGSGLSTHMEGVARGSQLASTILPSVSAAVRQLGPRYRQQVSQTVNKTPFALTTLFKSPSGVAQDGVSITAYGQEQLTGAMYTVPAHGQIDIDINAHLICVTPADVAMLDGLIRSLSTPLNNIYMMNIRAWTFRVVLDCFPSSVLVCPRHMNNETYDG